MRGLVLPSGMGGGGGGCGPWSDHIEKLLIHDPVGITSLTPDIGLGYKTCHTCYMSALG